MFDQNCREKVSVIVLAGGSGLRMNSPIPKQYLSLGEKPIVLHSLEVFLAHPEVGEVVVVCHSDFRKFFDGLPLKFASPGSQRQDSVYNGLAQVAPEALWVAVHDGVRPFITPELVSRLFHEGKTVGAATVAVPVKMTIKEVSGLLVQKTLPRERLWEIQTPQFMKKKLLEKGFFHIHEKQLTVTDDVSLAELLGAPVKIVEGSYKNIKITTAEDLEMARLWASSTV